MKTLFLYGRPNHLEYHFSHNHNLFIVKTKILHGGKRKQVQELKTNREQYPYELHEEELLDLPQNEGHDKFPQNKHPNIAVFQCQEAEVIYAKGGRE